MEKPHQIVPSISLPEQACPLQDVLKVFRPKVPKDGACIISLEKLVHRRGMILMTGSCALCWETGRTPHNPTLWSVRAAEVGQGVNPPGDSSRVPKLQSLIYFQDFINCCDQWGREERLLWSFKQCECGRIWSVVDDQIHCLFCLDIRHANALSICPSWMGFSFKLLQAGHRPDL